MNQGRPACAPDFLTKFSPLLFSDLVCRMTYKGGVGGGVRPTAPCQSNFHNQVMILGAGVIRLCIYMCPWGALKCSLFFVVDPGQSIGTNLGPGNEVVTRSLPARSANEKNICSVQGSV